jgi:DNA (cytosine-5)-methyltransferase 1
MASFYNEIEPYAAQWLRNLIKEGLIPDGEVSTTSIVDLRPSDLAGFTQCHFFAGIGGWSLALRLAGWPNDRPIWTGSCPCQPFSVAGKRAGTDDPRHLWPDFFRLIRACRPPVVVGEQVAGAAGYGWLDGVRADLAREGYASRGVDIPAGAVDAPHIRQRLYWVATDLGDANMPHGEGSGVSSRVHAQHAHTDCGGAHSYMADANVSGLRQRGGDHPPAGHGHPVAPEGRSGHWDDHIWLTGADGKSRRAKSGLSLLVDGPSGGVALVRAREDGTKETHTYSRVGALRAFGNAIVAPLAKEVIMALMEVLDGEQSLQEDR